MLVTRDLGRKRPTKQPSEALTGFERKIAIIIGIQSYRNSIPPLSTPINDGEKLASVLQETFGYRTLFLKDASGEAIRKLLAEQLPRVIRPNDRLLFYFAGHGVAQESDSGPNGYMVPVDGDPLRTEETYLAMADVNQWLEALPCRHLLVILDCCFAGTFRWSGTRRVMQLPEVQKERYKRYISGKARQVLTSTTQSEEALDTLGRTSALGMGRRGDESKSHSPFAAALIRGLQMGEADLAYGGRQDGLITATELYFYLEREVAHMAQAQGAHRQTPRLWPLADHGSGEFVFERPQFDFEALEAAPELTFENNPYFGLSPYQESDASFFFGREAACQELKQLLEGAVEAQEGDGQLIIVTGSSGSGKSSLVQAGLLPALRPEWTILGPHRPGRNPLQTFTELFDQWEEEYGRFSHPSAHYLLVIDNLDEIDLVDGGKASRPFLQFLGEKRRAFNGRLHMLVTVRHDYLSQLPLREDVAYIHRYTIPSMSHDNLRQVIEKPAAAKLLHFEPPELVDKLIQEVNQTPGALPLLSYTLSEMYKKHLVAQRQDRALTQADYDAVGGVTGALRQNIAGVYHTLPDEAHRQTMKRVLLRLVSATTNGLRQISPQEIRYQQPSENERVRVILHALDEKGLLVAGERIELAHDALLTVWGPFVQWQREAADYLPLQRRLYHAAKEWDEQPKAGDRQRLLWHDNPQLLRLEVIHQSDDSWFNELEAQFVARSLGRHHWAKRIGAGITALVFLIMLYIVLLTLRNNQLTASLDEVFAKFEEDRVKTADVLADAEKNQEKLTNIVTAFESLEMQLAEKEEEIEEVNSALAVAADELDAANQQVERRLNALERFEEFVVRESDFDLATAEDGTSDWEAFTQITAQLPGRQERFERQMTTMLVKLNERFSRFASPDLIRYEQAWLMLAQVTKAALSGEAAIPFRDLGNAIALFDERLLPHYEHFEGHEAGVDYVAYAGDGKTAVSASWVDGTIRLWDLTVPFAERTPIVLEGSTDFIGSIAFSPDSNWLAAAFSNGSVKVWDLTLSDPRRNPLVLHDHEEWVTAVTFSSDSQWLASGGRHGSMRMWNMTATDPSRQPYVLTGHENRVTDLAFAPDGNWLASSSSDQTVQLWRMMPDGPSLESRVLARRAGSALSVTFSPNSDLLAAALRNNQVRLWAIDEDDPNEEPIILPDYAGDGVGDLAFSAAGHLAYTATQNRVLLWQPPPAGRAFTAVSAQRLVGHKRRVTSIAFAPDGSTLASASEYGKIHLWDLTDETTVSSTTVSSTAVYETLGGHSGPITSLAFAPNGETLLSGSFDNSVRLWDLLPLPSLAPTILGGESEADESEADESEADESTAMTMASVASNGSRMATVQNGSVMLFDLVTAQTIRSLPHRESVQAVAVSPNGSWVATATPGEVWLWPEEGNPRLLTEAETAVHVLAFSADERLLATAADNQIKLWDLTAVSDTPAIILPQAGNVISAIVFSPTENRLATAAGTTVRLWDLNDLVARQEPQNRFNRLTKHADTITQLAFTPDGRQLASGTKGGVVKLWQLGAGEDGLLHTLTEHDGPVAAIAFSPEQNVLAVASAKSVNVWNLNAPESVLRPMHLQGHQDIVWALTFTPDGLMLASASADGTIHLRPTLAGIVEIACQQTSRNFSPREWQIYVAGRAYEAVCPEPLDDG
ncbi:MAG: caspase family protein [Chloroflexota bacterium]